MVCTVEIRLDVDKAIAILMDILPSTTIQCVCRIKALVCRIYSLEYMMTDCPEDLT
jgi:hypothetical protein